MLPVVLVLAAAPVPASAPTAPPTKLEEIGRTHTSVCTTIVVHANGVIAQTLENDRTLAILTTNLRTLDFDRMNVIQRGNAFDTLLKQTAQVRTAFRGADGEIKTLRKLADASPNEQRKRELKAFADALGGALARQKRAAAEFDRSLVVLDGRQATQDVRAIENAALRMNAPPSTDATFEALDRARDGALPPPPPRDGEWNIVMQRLAAAIDDGLVPIAVDEGTAADHSIAATTGC